MGYDLMDELTADDAVQKKASDVVIKKDSERALTAVEWYEEAYNAGCDFVFVASQDISRESDKRKYIERFKECYEMLADRFYREHTDVQVSTDISVMADEFAEIGVVHELTYSPSRADGYIIKDASYGHFVFFKVGVKNYSEPKRRLSAFMGFAAALYTMLHGTPSSYHFEVFPRQMNIAVNQNGVAPDDFFMLVDSDFGSYDNSFGPDFYYFKFDLLNHNYDGFEKDLRDEIKETVQELVRLTIIPNEFSKEAKKIIFNWTMKYINRNKQ